MGASAIYSCKVGLRPSFLGTLNKTTFFTERRFSAGIDSMTPHPSIFIQDASRIPLLTDRGREFQGLDRSSAPDLNERVRGFFELLNQKLGFADSVEGRVQQEALNELLRYVYPEIMIDLADVVYVQHERPMVFLNLDHFMMNYDADPASLSIDPPLLHQRVQAIFYALGNTLRDDPALCNDPAIVQYLSESYSFYLWLTKNFPWEDPLPRGVQPGDGPVLDVATGLTGFSLIHDWPESHPPLVLSDSMPFIAEGLNHFQQLTGRGQVEIKSWRFPLEEKLERPFGCVHVSKFLHHLQRDDRRLFLRWAHASMSTSGKLIIIDTDLEYEILKDAEDPTYKQKLMPGYLETLVRIEEKFCHHMLEDVREAGFVVDHFDDHEYYDETDAYSHFPGENLPLKLRGFELTGARR